MNSSPERLRLLPKVDDLLRCDGLAAAMRRFPRPVVADAVRDAVAAVREAILSGDPAADASVPAVAARARAILAVSETPGLRRVLNGTGIVLHTNLGRAPLAPEAVAAVAEAAAGYCNLEYDLSAGRRGDRTAPVEALLAEVAGAEAAAVANNCAAATLLLLDTLGRGREIIVSRGQLVEIGGSFRLPEVFEKSGCVLREVGTTNRTRIGDYAAAINERTAALMRVHASNYAIVGFAEAPGAAEMAELARARGIKMIDDVGSGLLRRELLGRDAPRSARTEPVVAESLAAGADVVCFSGDKLPGGPQAGLMVGRADVIAAVRRNPLMRALRVDKMTLAALEATLRLHRDPATARRRIPFWRMVTESEDAVRMRAASLARLLAEACPGLDVVLAESVAFAGGGSLPTEEIPSWSVAIDPAPAGGDEFAARLRALPLPLLGRLHRGWLVIDARTLGDSELPAVAEAVARARGTDPSSAPPG